METALKAQSETANRTLADQHQSANQKQRLLEKALNEHKTSADTNLISPAAEEKLRSRYFKEYDKSFTAEQERNLADRENIVRNSKERYDELRENSQRTQMLAQNRNTAERDVERKAMLEQIQDGEYNKDSALRSQQAVYEKRSANQERSTGISLNRQRQQYEYLFEEQKNDAQRTVASIRQEAEFNSKMAKRASAARENELIRNYEKRLADQKNDYDLLLSETRQKSDQAVRESEKRSRQMLEEQAKGYEQRIAQMDQQNKERERLIAQNQQEEIDRIKRSNALLIQKKS